MKIRKPLFSSWEAAEVLGMGDTFELVNVRAQRDALAEALVFLAPGHREGGDNFGFGPCWCPSTVKPHAPHIAACARARAALSKAAGQREASEKD